MLSIQSNRITKLENLEDLTALEELYISHNGIETLEGLAANVRPILTHNFRAAAEPAHRPNSARSTSRTTSSPRS